MKLESFHWLSHNKLWAIKPFSVYGKGEFVGPFYFNFSLLFYILRAFFNETIFPFPLIGYEMVIARSTLPASSAINQIIQRVLVE